MTLSFLYWFLLLVWVLFGGWATWRTPPETRWGAGLNVLLFLLLVIVGLKLFGSPLKGG